MSHSIWKIPRILRPKKTFLAFAPQSGAPLLLQGQKARSPINTRLRASVIGPDIMGQIVQVHNGQKFIPIRVTENLVGFKLGQFALTKKRVFHKRKKKK